MVNEEKRRVLENLVSFSQPLEQIVQALKADAWDGDIDLVILRLNNIRDVLQRYLEGQISAETVEAWANALECREDIGFALSNNFATRELLRELANPVLYSPLDLNRAQILIARIDRLSFGRV